MVNNEEKTRENKTPKKPAVESEAPPQGQAEETTEQLNDIEPDTTEEEREEAPEPPPDLPGPLASPDRSDDESEPAKIAKKASEEGPLEMPLPETENEIAKLMPPEQPPPKEQGELAPIVKPDLSLPESAAEVEEMPETAETEHEAAEELDHSTLPEGEVADKKTRPRPVIKKIAGLPSEEEADKRWYVIHAHSGHENKVRQTLETRVQQEHLEHLVYQIIVPTEEVAEVKGGKKRITSRKIFPGYVLVEMKLTYSTWYLIRTTSGVTGFIGSGKIPTALEPEEVESIFEQMRGEQKKPKPKVSFEKDDKVKIIEGPFTNFMGFVDEVNPERGKLKVMVEIFERLTPVELEFWQVEKV
jgi:transcriptional antiterminator NusG